MPRGPRCEPAVSWEQRAGLAQWCSLAPARGPQPSPRHQPLPLRGRSERVTSETTHSILTKAFEEGSPQLPSTCSALKRVGCPSDSPAPSRAPLTIGYPQLLWAGTKLDSLNPASLCTLVTPLRVSGVSVYLLGVALRKQQVWWGGVAVTTCCRACCALSLGAAVSPGMLEPWRPESACCRPRRAQGWVPGAGKPGLFTSFS